MFSFSDTWIFIRSILFTTGTIGFNCFYIVYYTNVLTFLFFISSYSFNTLFTETNSSWLIYEPIMVLEIKTLIIFILSFPNSTILLCFFFFFLIIYLYFLIYAVIAHIFIPTAELVIPTGTQTKESNTEMETKLVIVEAKISMYST